MSHIPREIRSAKVRAADGRAVLFGSMVDPVRTNLPYPGFVGSFPPGSVGALSGQVPQGQLLTNMPDGWELGQFAGFGGPGPVAWSDDVDDAGRPPAWWLGAACEDGWSPIGPHGPNLWHHASLPVVTRAVSLLVDPLTTGVFRVRQGAVSEEPPRWLSDPQLLRPDARVPVRPLPVHMRLPRSVFWRRWIATAVWWGRSFLLFAEDGDGFPLAGSLRLVNPHLVDEYDGVWSLGDGADFDEDGRIRFAGQWLRMVMLPNPHGPLGVFLHHPGAFDYARKISQYGSRVFGAGVPAGYLKVTNPGLTQDQADMLKTRWLAAHGDRRTIAVLNSTTDFTPISWNPVDTALAESYRLSIADVAYAFGMAPETLGVTLGNSATYSNVEQWFDAHRDFALSPWIAAVEGVLSSLLPLGRDVEVNLDAFTQPPYAARMAAHEVALRAGVRTLDEVRADEGWGPVNRTPEG